MFFVEENSSSEKEEKEVQFGMEENILKQIFFDEQNNWDRFVDKYRSRIRPIVIREVAKFRNCGEKVAGFSLFACPVCGEMKIVPHTRYLDAMDDGDLIVPPRFSCEVCGGEMRPVSYKGTHGQKYELKQ